MMKAAAPVHTLTVTILVDDDGGTESGRAEHGLSLWVDADRFRILFDSGSGGRLEENARQLAVDLAEADAFVVSHGHKDHTGGFSTVLSKCGKARIYLHPGALGERYSRSRDGSVHAVGCPLTPGEDLARRDPFLHWTSGMTRLHPAVFVTGEVKRLSPPEAPADHFFLDAGCTIADPLSDDQALVVDTVDGVVVLLGCSHAGVGNTLASALSHLPTRRLRAVVGGMHLKDASMEEITRAADALEELGALTICPCHCTGDRAKDYLRRRFPKAYVHGPVGTVVKLSGA